ncbi:MAG: hypothetical protein MN733_31175 [Nitrososphaera sp.]|nr:hypothetical protein [Nitrososphaera sp.]
MNDLREYELPEPYYAFMQELRSNSGIDLHARAQVMRIFRGQSRDFSGLLKGQEQIIRDIAAQHGISLAPIQRP